MDLLLVLIVILGFVIVVRGPKTLPKFGEALGRTVREIRKSTDRDDPPQGDGPTTP